ncbi:MAG: hypothetical protein JRI50_05220 [Deltaproteobacteria bacterium]|nr:hypothetical protein [Deltaproteobacteria bacterium]
MARQDKVLAAITAAVQAYIQDDEVVLMAQAAAPPEPEVRVPTVIHNLWGLAGRQMAMQLRVLIQRRSLK